MPLDVEQSEIPLVRAAGEFSPPTTAIPRLV